MAWPVDAVGKTAYRALYNRIPFTCTRLNFDSSSIDAERQATPTLLHVKLLFSIHPRPPLFACSLPHQGTPVTS